MRFEQNNQFPDSGGANEIFKRWLYGGLSYIQNHYRLFLLVILIITAAGWAQRIFLNNQSFPVLFIFGIITWVFTFTLYFGLLKICTTGDTDMSYWRHLLRILPDMIIATIIFNVAAGVGLLLFLVPGFLIMTRFMFFPFLMLEYDISIREAFYNSQIITAGYRWAVLLLIFFTILASLAEIPFLYVLFNSSTATGLQYVITSMLYAASILILKPLAIATLVYGYAQMHKNLATRSDILN